MIRKKSRHVFGFTIIVLGLRAGSASAAPPPPPSTLLAGTPTLALLLNGGNEFSTAFVPACGAIGPFVMLTDGIGVNRVEFSSLLAGHSITWDTGAPSPGPNVAVKKDFPVPAGQILLGGTPTGVCKPVTGSPAAKAAATAFNATLHCTGGTISSPRWGANSSDTSTTRVGDSAFMSFHAVEQLEADPCPAPAVPATLPCSQPRQQTRQLNGGPPIPPYPWLRRSSDCGNTADINLAVLGAYASYTDVTDGMTLYADPFTRAPDGTQVAYYGGSSNRQLLRIAPENQIGGIDEHITDLGAMGAGWHSTFTTTQGYLVGARGGLFIASCNGAIARIYYSYDDMTAPVTPSFKYINVGTCGTALNATTMGIARVAPASSAWDMVRVAFTSPVPGPIQTTCNCGTPPCTCSNYSVNIVAVKVPRPDNPGQPYLGAVTQYLPTPNTGVPGGPYPDSSALNLNFIQPDGFEYFKSHPGRVLPDTSVLTWTEGGSATTGGVPGMPATASYAIASGPPLVTPGAVDTGLSGALPLSVGCPSFLSCGADQPKQRVFYKNQDSLTKIGPDPNGSTAIVPTNLLDMGDFEDGTFSYDKVTDRFHFVTPWSGTDASQKPRVYYNVVELQPPPTRIRYFIDLTFTSLGTQLYLAKVRLPGPARVRFAGQTANGTWKRLATNDCENDDDTTTPDGDGPADSNVFSRTCRIHAKGIVKLAVLTRDVSLPHNVDLPSFGVEGIHEFFSTMDECGVPTAGASTHCFNDGSPAKCESVRGTCSADADCCTGLTCQSGACAPLPTCSTLRAPCTTTTDCCSGLACTSGLCE